MEKGNHLLVIPFQLLIPWGRLPPPPSLSLLGDQEVECPLFQDCSRTEDCPLKASLRFDVVRGFRAKRPSGGQATHRVVIHKLCHRIVQVPLGLPEVAFPVVEEVHKVFPAILCPSWHLVLAGREKRP